LIPAGTGLPEYNRKEIRTEAAPVEDEMETDGNTMQTAEASTPAGD
jgi:hypothetical protein